MVAHSQTWAECRRCYTAGVAIAGRGAASPPRAVTISQPSTPAPRIDGVSIVFFLFLLQWMRLRLLRRRRCHEMLDADKLPSSPPRASTCSMQQKPLPRPLIPPSSAGASRRLRPLVSHGLVQAEESELPSETNLSITPLFHLKTTAPSYNLCRFRTVSPLSWSLES